MNEHPPRPHAEDEPAGSARTARGARSAPTTPPARRSTVQIERDIARTRDRLDHTLDMLQQRLTPGALARQMGEAACAALAGAGAATAGSSGSSAVATRRSPGNELASAAIAGGAALLAAGLKQSSSRTGKRKVRGGAPPDRPAARRVRSRSRPVKSAGSRNGGEARHDEPPSIETSRSGTAAFLARAGDNDSREPLAWMGNLVRDHPIAVGAAAVAAGLAAALILPTIAEERESLEGETPSRRRRARKGKGPADAATALQLDQRGGSFAAIWRPFAREAVQAIADAAVKALQSADDDLEEDDQYEDLDETEACDIDDRRAGM